MKKLLLIVALMFTLTVISLTAAYAADHLSGKVVETLDSGGYTYVNIEKDSKSTWLAIPQTKITVGKEMSFKPGSVMNDFTR
ncbi:MAG: DNA-binding protein, partial [Desulfobacteraceae bacterium]|nr:DNA-binding protein [Desulfobacteraceae bacterium]